MRLPGRPLTPDLALRDWTPQASRDGGLDTVPALGAGACPERTTEAPDDRLMSVPLADWSMPRS